MLIYLENFYAEAERLSNLLGQMEFTDSTFGKEIAGFQHVPQGIEKGFENVIAGVKDKISLGSQSGTYRKPYGFIHFENFDEGSLFVAIVALKKTVVTIHNHKEKNISRVFEVQENFDEFVKTECGNPESWDVKSKLVLEVGDMALIQPWYFHSIESEFVKVFYLNLKKEQKLEDTVVGEDLPVVEEEGEKVSTPRPSEEDLGFKD
jgi:hypothetical protein